MPRRIFTLREKLAIYDLYPWVPVSPYICPSGFLYLANAPLKTIHIEDASWDLHKAHIMANYFFQYTFAKE